METTIVYWGLYRENGKHKGNYRYYRDYRECIQMVISQNQGPILVPLNNM